MVLSAGFFAVDTAPIVSDFFNIITYVKSAELFGRSIKDIRASGFLRRRYQGVRKS